MVPMTDEIHAKPDLGSLRIDDHKRGSGSAGKRIALIVVGLVILIAIAGGFYAYMPRAAAVEVATVQQADTGPQVLLNASGYVTPQRRATVAAKITGRVTGVFFTEGMHVHKGYVLAKLDDSDSQKALAAAIADRNATQGSIADLQVQLKNAELQLHRAQELQKQGVQTQEALDNARMAANSLGAKIDYARQQVLAGDARIKEAQQAVDNCVIRAPFDGIIVSKDAQVGEIVSPLSAGGGFTRTGIATIVDMASNEIQVDVNENYIARVKPKQEVTATLDAYPDWKIPAHVRTIIPTADRQKATVEVRVAFDKLDPRILPDMGVKITFLGEEARQTEKAPSGLMVPQSAIRDDGGQKIVFLVKDNHVERHAVKVGASQGSQAQLLAGVTAGDRVVVRGPADLKDGEAVEVKQ
ncbi:MAG TPA: efflux RND transporter periplasmic adaptor subunit [Candidatus Acidoferrales bacterium]|nr:efflux RND transporter periplasmic adaptor subunit [Candidatus Acidoferrales bacterium]